jgi:thiol-disulfide isomerase/thioredoxin
VRLARLVAALGLAGCVSAAQPAAVAQLPADGRLVDATTHAPFVAAERFRGHVVVLDFWASWCQQCRETVPQVRRLAEAFAPRGLVVIGVNAGDPAPEAADAARAFGIAYPIALDPELAFSDRLGASGLPTLVVLDRDGRIAHRAKHVDEETLAVIRKLLGG